MSGGESALPRAAGRRRLPILRPRSLAITTSELASYRTCQYRWRLAYQERLRPVHAARTLRFGTAIHRALEAGYRVLMGACLAFESLLVLQGLHVVPASLEALRRVWGELGLDAIDEAEDSRRTLEAAEWAIQHYWQVHSADLERVIPLAIEQPFEIDMVMGAGRRSAVTRLAGVIDLVYYDRQVRDIVVADHKTTSGDVASIDRRVELDPQIAGYVYAVREALRCGRTDLLPGLRALGAIEERRALDGAIRTGRVVYNVLRARAPREPEVTKAGMVSAAKIDTTAALYEAALVAQEARGIARTPVQAQLLERLEARGDTYLSRREFWRSDDEIARWRAEMVIEARRIRHLRRHPEEAVRNPGACTQASSPSCVYRSVCLEPGSPELRAEFRVADSAHEEVEAAIEEEVPT